MKLIGYLLFLAVLGCSIVGSDAYSILRNAMEFSPEDSYTIAELSKKIVPCPVCANSPWLDEGCTKGFKMCKYGTYVNEVCGNRLDCLQGPNEICTEKQEFDMHGKRCMNGTKCIKSTGRCSDPDQPDIKGQWEMNGLTKNHQYQLFDNRFTRFAVPPQDAEWQWQKIRAL